MQKAGEDDRRDHRGEIGAGEGERQQAIAIAEQLAEHSRALMSPLAAGANFQIVGRNQRDLGSGEKRLHHEASGQRHEQPHRRHRCSLTSSTAAPRTRSMVASNSPSLSFSPARGTRPSLRRTRLLRVLPPPYTSTTRAGASASASLPSASAPEAVHSSSDIFVSSGSSLSNSSRISPNSSSSKSS